MPSMRVLLVLAALIVGCSSTSPIPDDAFRVLFVGNSLTYTNDLPGMVAAFAEAQDRPWYTESVALPNYSLEDHWYDGRAMEALNEEVWDAIVFQQGPSSLPENQAHLAMWATRWAESVREGGGTPALYMVWPSSDRRNAFPAVVQAYTSAADASGSRLLPAGSAWLAAWEEIPNLALYGPDGFHPSETGTYLAALVVYGGLSGASLDGLPATLDLEGGRISILEPRARQLQLIVTSVLVSRAEAAEGG